MRSVKPCDAYKISKLNALVKSVNCVTEYTILSLLMF